MEGLVEFDLMGMEMFFVTELKKATCDPNTDLLQNPNQKCYFGHKYYINPPDDHKSLEFRFELWQISPTAEDGSRMGDLRLVKADYEYDLNYEGYPPKYKTFESEGAFGHDNELEVRIKTLSMDIFMDEILNEKKREKLIPTKTVNVSPGIELKYKEILEKLSN